MEGGLNDELRDISGVLLAHLENPTLILDGAHAGPGEPYALGPGGVVQQLLVALDARLCVVERAISEGRAGL